MSAAATAVQPPPTSGPPVPTGLAALTGAQRCAILMLILGEEAAAEILSRLSPRDVQTLGQAMYSVANVSQADVSAVVDSFIVAARAQSGVGLGAGDFVREVFMRALGEDRAAAMLARITPAETTTKIEVLQWMDARAIAELLAGEHPQIIAAVLGFLAPEFAGEVLNTLPEACQPDVILRLASLEAIPPEALGELEKVLNQQFAASHAMGQSGVGGIDVAAKIMNFTSSATEQRIVRALFEQDEEIAQAIQAKMLTFEHLSGMDDKSLGTLVRAIDMPVLVVALKGADEALRTRMLGQMTSRAATQVTNEMAEMGPVRLLEVQEAQRAILNRARAMADEGTIILSVRGGDFV